MYMSDKMTYSESIWHVTKNVQ